MGGSSEVLLLVLGYVGHRQPTILPWELGSLATLRLVLARLRFANRNI